eukprot:TRINITY_DN2131_c0_g3_i1.p1 TRINITY_DN2131_c0_g3~~TRINITY_DN2131_c0_g3_i1.p1  ORF type:complete len:482 (-),score=64.99 TRINITY_DN2131_c0_g3_i1:405-1799(-)
MATRVAGSLCIAAGCGKEMVVSSWDEYEETAVMYATNPAKLKAVTEKLRAGRLTCPLFDTKRWVKNMDTALKKMWRLHCDGQPVQHFKVFENERIFDYEGSPSGPLPLGSKTPCSSAVTHSFLYSLMPAASLDIPPQKSSRDGGLKAPLQQPPHHEFSSLRALSGADLHFGGGGSGYMGAQNEPGESGSGYVLQEQLTPRAGQNAASFLRGGRRQRQAPGYYDAPGFTAGPQMGVLEGYVGSRAYDSLVGGGRESNRNDRFGGTDDGPVGAGTEGRSGQLRGNWKSVGLSEDQAAGLSANRAVLANGKLPSGYHISGGPGLTLQMGHAAETPMSSDGFRDGPEVTRGTKGGNRSAAGWTFQNGSGFENGDVQEDWGSAFVRKSDVRGGTASAPIDIEGLDAVGSAAVGSAKDPINIGEREDPGAPRWEKAGRVPENAAKPRGYTLISLQHELPESIAKCSSRGS